MVDVSEHIQGILNTLPEKPGVYIMKNAAGQVIYVGKAIVLKNRVRSYFQDRGQVDRKVRKLVEQIRDLEWIVVGFRTRSPDPGNEPDQETPPAFQRAVER